MFYFLNYGYNPNTAATNRALAYIKGLSELSINTTVLFFLTDRQKSEILQSFPHITIEYYWKKWFYINNKYFKHICYILFLISFFFRVKKGDTLYMYNMADVLHWILKKKGVRVFVEKTEHPSMYPLGSHVYRPSMEQYHLDCRKATGVITVSTSLKHYFEKNGVSTNKIRIINMIVDSNRFVNISPMQFDYPYFAYCGTVSSFKDGVDILIKSFAVVHEKFPNVQLRIAGRFYNKKDEELLLGLVEDLNLSNTVIFMGLVNACDMPSFLAGAKAVLLSRPNNIQAKNGFPGKLGEYLLSKSPTIVTSVGDIPLFIKDGENGFIVKPDDYIAFAEKMIWVLNNEDKAKMIGEKGFNLAFDQFNYLTETKKMVDFLFK